MWRGCGCRGSTGWMGARFATRPMFRRRVHQRKNSAGKPPKHEEAGPSRAPASVRNPRKPVKTAAWALTAFRRQRLLVLATTALQVPHLVQPAFLFRSSLAGHPLPLFDQLAHLLAALVTDLGVELRAASGTDGLAALLANLLVELVPALRLHRLAALASD